ncbi:MAG: hypothetical protein R3B82_08040 [Sandaracinaceae bacterium]
MRFAEGTRSRAPGARPLVWEFPEDARSRVDDQMMLGPFLLDRAGPRARRASRRLPAGRWY